MALQPGMRLGRYEIVSLLGEGGFADVYKGYQPEYDREVAIKVLHEWLSKDQRILARFREEAIKTFNLQHPNIVRVIDFQEDKGFYFIVMELVEGRSLRQLINLSNSIDFTQDDAADTRLHGSDSENVETRLHEASSGYQGMDVGIVSSIFRDVCSALSYAHGMGIIHRDVKPDNILVSKDGRALLVDFGIAKAQDEALHLTSTGVRIGSALYMAPEQIKVIGKKEDYRSDIYSLGVTIYEVLTGTPPFVGADAESIWRMHLTATPVPPSKINPDLPAAYDEVVLKCLEKDPNDRYQSSEEVAQALVKVASPKPITTLFGITPPNTVSKKKATEDFIACPVCGYSFHYSSADEDESVDCPACNHRFTIREGQEIYRQRELEAEKLLKALGLENDLSLDVKDHEYKKTIKGHLDDLYSQASHAGEDALSDGSVILPEEDASSIDKYTAASTLILKTGGFLESEAITSFIVNREARRYWRQAVSELKSTAYGVIGKYHTALAASSKDHEKAVREYDQAISWYQKAQEQAKKSGEKKDTLTSRFEGSEDLAKLILDFAQGGKDDGVEQVIRSLDGVPDAFLGAGADKEKARSYDGLYQAKLSAIKTAKKEIDETLNSAAAAWKEWCAFDVGAFLAPLRTRISFEVLQRLGALIRNDMLVHLALWGFVFLLWAIARTAFTAGTVLRAWQALSLLPTPHFLLPSAGSTRTALAGLTILVPWSWGYWWNIPLAMPKDISQKENSGKLDIAFTLMAMLTLVPWMTVWIYGGILAGSGYVLGKYLDKETSGNKPRLGMYAGLALLAIFTVYLVIRATLFSVILIPVLALTGWLTGIYVRRLDALVLASRLLDEKSNLVAREYDFLHSRLLFTNEMPVAAPEGKETGAGSIERVCQAAGCQVVPWDLKEIAGKAYSGLLPALGKIGGRLKRIVPRR